jgi:hypothetical protein
MGVVVYRTTNTAKRDKKERSSFLSLLICPALSGYPYRRNSRKEIVSERIEGILMPCFGTTRAVPIKSGVPS